jgi:hypothetical protein
MVYFQTKNPNLVNFWRTLEWRMLVVYFVVISDMLRPFGIIHRPFNNVVAIWYSFPNFGI